MLLLRLAGETPFSFWTRPGLNSALAGGPKNASLQPKMYPTMDRKGLSKSGFKILEGFRSVFQFYCTQNWAVAVPTLPRLSTAVIVKV
jgi:hypothetical protein